MLEEFTRMGYLQPDGNGRYIIAKEGMKNILDDIKEKIKTKGPESLDSIEKELYEILDDERRKIENRYVI